ncbi:Protein of unknown function [Pyronema omphalodes CBS 100304]|uniref:Uncharacterized protein n=1 Tax=Pyronema omphalodes (strain CBS 100304) TaxID=1076935 RepID=U4LFJ0_PYROM|nr:Protein of unknown function [Pyronema omphalodes CBS 100304]
MDDADFNFPMDNDNFNFPVLGEANFNHLSYQAVRLYLTLLYLLTKYPFIPEILTTTYCNSLPPGPDRKLCTVNHWINVLHIFLFVAIFIIYLLLHWALKLSEEDLRALRAGFEIDEDYYMEIFCLMAVIGLLVMFWYGGWYEYFGGVVRGMVWEGGWYQYFGESLGEIWGVHRRCWEYMEVAVDWLGKRGV